MTAPLSIAPIPVEDSVRMCRYIMELIPAYWEAQIAGRLSRHVGPTEELEETMIRLLTDIWRATGSAIREGRREVVLKSSLDASELEIALDASERMLAFVPFAQEAGVMIEPDPHGDAVLRRVIESFIGEIGARAEAAAHEE